MLCAVETGAMLQLTGCAVACVSGGNRCVPYLKQGTGNKRHPFADIHLIVGVQAHTSHVLLTAFCSSSAVAAGLAYTRAGGHCRSMLIITL